ncbi:pyrroline-5-carboxylate reductase dimerization domain-containing protein [Enterovirga sp.]|uniref:pyrroline-5-carboxylate reductase family protein n=1 Tax=Enterovirga sp. TaxID=2026350 RepID=UPI002D021B67|nr:pyrroline-5-carboxylate reductase dimerization domain-containing protein [Enterovirga sp.]HMO28002.1 pyrroline-5-carboxylate reductase dimerization domain-containing protein [Enterovirga sp.]
MPDRPSRILIVGTGRLAEVLARASVRAAPSSEVAILGRNPVARDNLLASIPGLLPGSVAFASRAELIVLAVLPQAYRDVVLSLAPHLSPSAIVTSVTNGVALDEIGHWTRNPVVKVIPTIAQSIGRGSAPVVAGPRATPGDLALVSGWLGGFSLPVAVEEQDIRLASNVSGSAVAIVARFARAFVDANARRSSSLGRSALDAMMAETLVAVGELMRAGVDFEQAVEATATPGGVTEAMLRPLAASVDALCRDMVDAGFSQQALMQGGTLPADGDGPVAAT